MIAAYNAQDCLAASVNSVLTQDFKDLELLIVDDGSTDQTFAVAQELAFRDPRIQLFRLERNQGPSAARNRGLAAARGEWVAILDADDEILPSRLGHLLELAARRNADAVADDLVLYDSGADQRLPPAYGWEREQALGLDMLLANDGAPNRYPLGWIQPMWRREFLNNRDLRYPVQYRYMEDFFVLASALLCGARIWLSPRAEYVYTLRHGPISRQPSKFSSTQVRFEDVTACIGELIDRYRGGLDPAQTRKLRDIQRRLSAQKTRMDAITARRERGIVAALLILWRHPVTACSLAFEKVAGSTAGLRTLVRR